jgi:hypothetical protein
MKSLNLSKLKKISSDKNSTVFQHPDGHTIKIVHSALKDPGLKKELDKVPLHKASGGMIKKYADGSDDEPVSKDDSAPSDQSQQQAPVVVNVGTGAQGPTGPQIPQQPQNQQTLAPQSQQPQAEPAQQSNQPSLGVDTSFGNSPYPTTLSSQIAPVSGDQAQPVDTYQQSYNDYKQAHQKEFAEQDAAFDQDLKNGHITPETYNGLFAKKDTLGKIGMIFGMMASGAGSGLAHQQNAYLHMMDQTIQNDLDAQRQSKANAQNFIRLGQQQQMTTAQTHLMGAQAKNQLAEADLNNQAATLMRMNRTAVHNQAMLVAKLPPGSPQRAAQEQTLAAMSQAVDAKNASIGDIAASKIAMLHQMGINMSGQSDQPSGEIDQTASQLRKMQALGYIDKDQYNKANEELKMVQNKEQANQGALDSFDKVSKLTKPGNRIMNPIQSPKQINAEWDPMLDKLTKSNEGRVTPITVDMMNGIKPTGLDSDETTAIKRQKLSEILNAGYSTPTLDGLNMSPKKPMKQSPQVQQQTGANKNVQDMMSGSNQGPAEGTVGNFKGKAVIFKNGKWTYQ